MDTAVDGRASRVSPSQLREAGEQSFLSQDPRQDDNPHAEGTVLMASKYHSDLPPISKLHDEILIRIIILYRDGDAESSQRRPLRLLGATFVCRRWRTVALGYPLLWNTIHFDCLNRCKGAPEDWITAFIQRSAEVPLDLDMCVSHIPPRLQELFISQSFRWRNVLIRAIDRHMPFFLDRFTLFPTPLLESFKVTLDRGSARLYDEKSSRRDNPDDIMLPENLFTQNAPNLHVLELGEPIHVSPSSPILRSLTSLKLYRNLSRDNILAVLASAPNLESLRVIPPPTGYVIPVRTNAADLSSAKQSSHDKLVELSSLQEFRVWSHLPLDTIHLLRHLDLPALRRIGFTALGLFHEETLPFISATLPFAQAVQRNDAPIEGVFISHTSHTFGVVGWSLAQMQAMNPRPIIDDGLSLTPSAYRVVDRPPFSVEPIFYFCCANVQTYGDYHRPDIDTIWQQILLNPTAVRVLALDISQDRPREVWHRRFGLWTAVERLEVVLNSLSLPLLEAATPTRNTAKHIVPLFPRLKKLVLRGGKRRHGSDTMVRLCELAASRSRAGTPFEIDFRQYKHLSANNTTDLRRVARVMCDGEEWQPFLLDNFEQIADEQGRGVWGNMYHL